MRSDPHVIVEKKEMRRESHERGDERMTIKKIGRETGVTHDCRKGTRTKLRE